MNNYYNGASMVNPRGAAKFGHLLENWLDKSAGRQENCRCLGKVCNQQRNGVKQQLFGNGKSASLFSEILSSRNFWETKKQKAFKDAASNIVAA